MKSHAGLDLLGLDDHGGLMAASGDKDVEDGCGPEATYVDSKPHMSIIDNIGFR